MSKRNVADLVTIAQLGGGFDLSAKDYTPVELLAVASKLCTNATLRIRDAGAWSTDDLGSIAQHGPPGAVQYLF